MNFIELKQGTIIKIDHIESVERTNSGGSKITMASGKVHQVQFKNNQLIQMIKLEMKNNLHGQFLAS